MPFDLARIRAALEGAPLSSPYPLDLSIAVVNDCLRMGNSRPIPLERWTRWEKQGWKLWPEQMGMLAHFLNSSPELRQETVRLLAQPNLDAAAALESFFKLTAPLTAEMIRSNAFRQEEFLRKWARVLSGAIAGESEDESAKRLAKLDYAQTLVEYERAETARKKEAEKRQKALEEAAKRDTEARGWRE